MWTVFVCPFCGATSTEHPAFGRPAGEVWSAAGRCHLGVDAVVPDQYVPEDPILRERYEKRADA